MRALILSLAALWPACASADDFQLSSRVTGAELYPQGATLTRTVPFEIPAGQHDLIIPDLPLDAVDAGGLNVAVSGATLGALHLRSGALPPRDIPESPEVTAARAEITRIKAQISLLDDRRAGLHAQIEGQQARISFLGALGGPEAGAMSDDALLDRLTLIAEGTAEAHGRIIALKADIRSLTPEADYLAEALTDAEQALEALMPDETPRGIARVTVTADSATTGALTITHVTQNAGWRPGYDLRLDRDNGTVTLIETALIQQQTGEAWHDVSVTLSSTMPDQRLTPGDAHPQHWRITEGRAEAVPNVLMRSAGADAEAVYDNAPTIVEELAPYDGLSVTRLVAAPLNLAPGAEAQQVTLGTRELPAEVFARATVPGDDTAYVVARVTLPDDLLLMQSNAVMFRDGGYVGSHWLDQTSGGKELELPFGPIPGLTIAEVPQRDQQGDAGLLGRKSRIESRRAFTVSNHGAESWDLHLRTSVPYSTQDDLTITWTATPDPTVVAPDGLPGVLEWQSRLTPKAEARIDLYFEARWPEDMQLLR